MNAASFASDPSPRQPRRQALRGCPGGCEPPAAPRDTGCPCAPEVIDDPAALASLRAQISLPVAPGKPFRRTPGRRSPGAARGALAAGGRSWPPCLRGLTAAAGDPPETIFLGLMRLQVVTFLRIPAASIHRFRPRLNSNLKFDFWAGQAANLPAKPARNVRVWNTKCRKSHQDSAHRGARSGRRHVIYQRHQTSGFPCVVRQCGRAPGGLCLSTPASVSPRCWSGRPINVKVGQVMARSIHPDRATGGKAEAERCG